MITVKLRQLDSQHQQIEPFRVLVVIAYRGWQVGQLLGHLRRLLGSESPPLLPIRVAFHPPAPWPDQEVVQVHALDDRVQAAGRRRTKARSVRVPSSSATPSSPRSVRSKAVIRPSRASKSRSASDFCSDPSEPAVGWLKYSRF